MTKMKKRLYLREKRGRFNLSLSISELPSDATGLETFGQWELYTVISR